MCLFDSGIFSGLYFTGTLHLRAIIKSLNSNALLDVFIELPIFAACYFTKPSHMTINYYVTFLKVP